MAQRRRENRLGAVVFAPRMELEGETGLKPVRLSQIAGVWKLLAGFCMVAFYLEALTGIAVALSVLMAGAWTVQQPTGNSGWVDTIWTFSLGLVGAGSALWPDGGG